MFRKVILALTTAATLGTAALAPSTASAFPFFHPHGHGHWHFGHWGFGGGGDDGSCYVVRKIVITPSGSYMHKYWMCD